MARSVHGGPYTPSRGKFAGQTFGSYRQYRNALARTHGYASLSAQQRAARPITAQAAYASLGPSERQSYSRSLEAVRLLRKGEARTLGEAARMAGTTPNTVRRYAGTALDTRGPKIVSRPTDRLIRPMRVITTEGVQTLLLESLKDASVVGRHAAAVRRYLEGRGSKPLDGMAGAYVTVGVKRYYLQTDHRTLDDLAIRGELSFETIYEDVA